MSLNDKHCCGNCRHRSVNTAVLREHICDINENLKPSDIWDYACNKFEFRNPLGGTEPKDETCTHAHVNFLRNEQHDKLLICSKTNETPNPEICKSCEYYSPRWLQFPITVNEIINTPVKTECTLSHKKPGTLCRIRPCGKEYENKTFLGIYIGELPDAIYSSYNSETKSVINHTSVSPAIFVPALSKIVYGSESFWSVIDSEEDLKDITDSDIDSQFYVRLLKNLTKSE